MSERSPFEERYDEPTEPDWLDDLLFAVVVAVCVFAVGYITWQMWFRL